MNYPHICQPYEVGPNYLVMEFIEGAPLKGPLGIEPSSPRELFAFRDRTGQPDGQRFLVRATAGQTAQTLTVIVNWPALLKKGATQQ